MQVLQVFYFWEIAYKATDTKQKNMLRKCRIAPKFRSGSGRNWKSSSGSGAVPAGTQKRIPVHP